jgi:predicted RNA polymerase sigma factor
VVSLLPDEPEAKGMLALMLYAEARRAARRDSAGTYVPLDEHDVALWDESQLEAAEALLHQANAAGPSGRYQLEAAIQSAHMARCVSGRDTRRAILALYDHLVALTGSPVAALNRAWPWQPLKALWQPSTSWARSRSTRGCSGTSPIGRRAGICLRQQVAEQKRARR